MSARSASLIIAASESDSNLYYTSRFLAPDPIIYFEIAGKKYLILSDLEIDRAKEQAKVHQILSLSEITKKVRYRKKNSNLPLFVRVINSIFKSRKIKQIQVPANFPSQYYSALKKLGYQIKIKPDPFYKKRLIKSPAEKKYIRHTLIQVEKALKEALTLLEKSKIKGRFVYHGKERLTSELLKKIINSSLMDSGCVADHTIVSSGVHASLPHHEGEGPIIAHTPTIFDIFPRNSHTLYWGDMTRTIVKGKPSDEVKKMYRAVLEANKRAKEEVASGVLAKKVHRAAADCLEKKGFKTSQLNGRMQGFIHSTGHGLGLDVHELPSISPLGKRLQKGNVITIEPGLYYEKHGGIRLEDVVYVTKRGFEQLTKFPKFLEIDRA